MIEHEKGYNTMDGGGGGGCLFNFFKRIMFSFLLPSLFTCTLLCAGPTGDCDMIPKLCVSTVEVCCLSLWILHLTETTVPGEGH